MLCCGNKQPQILVIYNNKGLFCVWAIYPQWLGRKLCSLVYWDDGFYILKDASMTTTAEGMMHSN